MASIASDCPSGTTSFIVDGEKVWEKSLDGLDTLPTGTSEQCVKPRNGDFRKFKACRSHQRKVKIKRLRQ